jgi:hypothetical protein
MFQWSLIRKFQLTNCLGNQSKIDTHNRKLDALGSLLIYIEDKYILVQFWLNQPVEFCL